MDSIKIEVEGQVVSVVGGSFHEMLATVKEIEGRKFDGQRRVWTLPCSLEVAREAMEAEGYEVQGAADSQRSDIEQANAAQMFIRANEDAIHEMIASLSTHYECYSYRSKSQVKAQLGRRMGMLKHALGYARIALEDLDNMAIATMVKTVKVIEGEIKNPSWATRGSEK